MLINSLKLWYLNSKVYNLAFHSVGYFTIYFYPPKKPAPRNSCHMSTKKKKKINNNARRDT